MRVYITMYPVFACMSNYCERGIRGTHHGMNKSRSRGMYFHAYFTSSQLSTLAIAYVSPTSSSRRNIAKCTELQNLAIATALCWALCRL
jgi:hypothetical protein